MSKLTFRAGEDLVERLESLDTSKSEAMREALREYLDARDAHARTSAASAGSGSIDAMIAERVDALVEERLASRGDRDVNVNVSLEGLERTRPASDADPTAEDAPSPDSAEESCGQCGEPIAADHVYCPNCGEKRSRRVFCDCGDELRTDWSFCPSCGRRTPAADVLDRS